MPMNRSRVLTSAAMIQHRGADEPTYEDANHEGAAGSAASWRQHGATLAVASIGLLQTSAARCLAATELRKSRSKPIAVRSSDGSGGPPRGRSWKTPAIDTVPLDQHPGVCQGAKHARARDVVDAKSFPGCR